MRKVISNTQVEQTFFICGRNRVVLNPKEGPHYYEMEKKYKIEENMRKLGLEYAIQGETCGPKINGNKMKLKENDFFVFNIYDIKQRDYLSWTHVLEVCKTLGLKTVEPVDTNYIASFGYKFDGVMTKELANSSVLLSIAEKLEYIKGVIAEGFVIKTDYGIGFPRTSLKVISNKFLIKYNL